MKTRRLVLAAGVLAGISALPMTTASAASSTTPAGSARAAALSLQLSLAPIKNLVNTVGAPTNGVLSWEALTSQLAGLAKTVCSTPAGCPINLDILSDMPDTLQVAIAQANDAATLNGVATDIVAGHADSTPLYTNWESVNANLSSLVSAVQSLQDQISAALASDNVATATALLNSGLSSANLGTISPVLSIDPLKVLSTVQANLNQPPAQNQVFDSANAVQASGQNALSGFNVTVDPFTACAASAAQAGQCGAAGAQTSAANTLVNVGLPAINLNTGNTASLKDLAATLKSLLNTLTNAIANPSQAGSILSSAASSAGLPAPIASSLTTIGGLLDGTTGSASTTTAKTVNVDLLKLWDTKVSAQLDSLNAIINAVAGLDLPDVTKLVTSTSDIATAKTVPVAGGGVLSTATSTLGALDVLPVGQSLATTIDSVLGQIPAVAGITVNQLNATTPVLSIAGITSSAQAGVGAAPACSDGKFVCGSSGLRTVSVLGQTIDLDHSTVNGTNPGLPTLGDGQELHDVISIPTLGSVTLDITRGLPQIVADTPTYREVNVAALDVRLINGAVGCDHPNQCTELPGSGTNTEGNTQGISALGKTGDTVADVSVAASAAKSGTVVPENDHIGNTVNLPSTGMFGGAALPAGLGLIAVAISLRLVPSLRLRLRRVR